MAEDTEGQNMCGDIAINVINVLDSVLDSIQQKLRVTTSSLPLHSNEQPTIYRVPKRIRQHENEAYEPRSVSIGPYHHNKKNLEPMEEHKLRYLVAILSRNPEVSLEHSVVKIMALEAQARRSYSESIELDSNEFLEMMLLDGCFIVELFAKNWEDDSDDPIYSNVRLLMTVCADMLLLENQLPYCILQCIFSCVFPDEDADVLFVKAAIRFCDNLLWLPLCDHRREVGSYHHLLHLIRCHLLPSPRNPPRSPKFDFDLDCWDPTILSAEKLDESGIKFKKKAGKDSVLDVEFKKGVMEIPFLVIDDFTIVLFRNFVAFEQCHPSAGSYFTAYTDFMDAIINTKADVEILREKGILRHAFGSDEELVHLFSGLTKGNVILTDDYLLSLYWDLHGYFKSKRRRWRASYWETKWLRWRASLMRDYFRNPWSIIALIGAIVVIVLTAIQSFYSVYSYARPPHQS